MCVSGEYLSLSDDITNKWFVLLSSWVSSYTHLSVVVLGLYISDDETKTSLTKFFVPGVRVCLDVQENRLVSFPGRGPTWVGTHVPNCVPCVWSKVGESERVRSNGTRPVGW